jgi:hypothetical protein
MAKLPGFLKDWRFILVYIGIAGGIAALVLTGGGGTSPIDRYMASKGGGGISSILKGGGGGGSAGSIGGAPEGSFELIGSKGGTLFVYLLPEYLDSKSALRSIGAAACEQAKSNDYCSVYFWTKKEDIEVALPVKHGGSLAAYYENKDGRVNLKIMPPQ